MSCEEYDEPSARCDMCGSPAYFMGILGNLAWFRCRHCGWETSCPLDTKDSFDPGLIPELPERSQIMASSVSFKYTGNLQGLIETLEATFKDPNGLTLVRA